MEKKGRDLGNQVENEEELLNFDLDDLSTQDLDKLSLDSDDEIIELTELVEKGPDDEETRAMDVNWREGGPEPEAGIDFSTHEIAKAMDGAPDESSSEDELDLSDISLELDLKDEAEGEPEPESKGFAGEITADELDSILEEKPVRSEVEMVEEPQQETEPQGDISEADLEGIFDESSQEEELDFGEEPEIEEPDISAEEQRAAVDFLESAREDDAAVALEPEEEPESDRETQPYIDMENLAPPADAEPELDETTFEPTPPESMGISEEKIEAAITRAVEDVAERVIRETVAEVTERVLNEVIDALKKSLEPPSE